MFVFFRDGVRASFLGERIFFLHPGVSERFSIKGQVAGVSGFVVSVTAAQLCHCRREAAAGSGSAWVCGRAPIKRIYDTKR